MKINTAPAFIAASMLIASPGVAFARMSVSQPQTENAEDGDQKVKCRKIQVTGSLIRKGKVCRTMAEWKHLQQLGNDAARLMAGENVCTGGECRGIEPAGP
jgi:hypothetical protein